LHNLTTSFVLGYHGCDEAVAETVLRGASFELSTNDYDWLGPGIYFWEANPKRGLEYAAELAALRRGKAKISRPFVVGAVVNLGLCLDLTTSAGIRQVADAHSKLVEIAQTAGMTLPKNNKDGLRRNLDCAVIRTLHQIRKANGDPAIDTVKGIFVEGQPLYPTSGFNDKTHIQICVLNADCIKGVFRVPAAELA
jgi:hypothetical protein